MDEPPPPSASICARSRRIEQGRVGEGTMMTKTRNGRKPPNPWAWWPRRGTPMQTVSTLFFPSATSELVQADVRETVTCMMRDAALNASHLEPQPHSVHMSRFTRGSPKEEGRRRRNPKIEALVSVSRGKMLRGELPSPTRRGKVKHNVCQADRNLDGPG
jgi:hypothetical protein